MPVFGSGAPRHRHFHSRKRNRLAPGQLRNLPSARAYLARQDARLHYNGSTPRSGAIRKITAASIFPSEQRLLKVSELQQL